MNGLGFGDFRLLFYLSAPLQHILLCTQTETHVTCIHIKKGHTRLFPLDFISYLIFPLHHMCLLCLCASQHYYKKTQCSILFCTITCSSLLLLLLLEEDRVSAQLFLHALNLITILRSKDGSSVCMRVCM